MNMKDIQVYSATWCGPCKVLKEGLDEAGVEYTVHWVDKDEEAREYLGSVLKSRSVPTIVVDGKIYTGDFREFLQEVTP